MKLEEALTLATDFHNSLQDFINWLTQAEQTLNMVSPASLILETIQFQIDEHKVMLAQGGRLHNIQCKTMLLLFIWNLKTMAFLVQIVFP